MGIIVKNKVEYGKPKSNEVDEELNILSRNPLQNKIITKELENKADKDSAVFTGSISLGRIGDIGEKSVAIGNGVKASGIYSQSFGHGSVAKGTGSHAEGINTVSSGNGSHTSGIGTKSSQEGKMSTGKYNTDETDAIFEVGNGTNDDNRSNAMSVKKDGTIVAKKDVVLEDGTSVTNIKSKVTELGTDITNIKSKVTELGTDITETNNSVDGIKQQLNGFTISLIDGVPYLTYDDGL